MLGRLRFVKRVFVDLPSQLRLGYCLARDNRVPITTRAAFLAGAGLLLAPKTRIPRNIPLIGELDSVALLILALRLFIGACPDEVVLDVEQAIIEQRSVFDDDVRRAERLAMSIAGRFRRHGDDDMGYDSSDDLDEINQLASQLATVE